MSLLEPLATLVFPNPEPFLRTTFIIQLHVLTAFMMVGFSAAIVLSPKGTRVHRAFGKGWVFFMALVALTSFFIWDLKQVGPFSWIHLLSIVTLIGIFDAVRSIRRGDVQRHKATMQSLIVFGVITAGAFTFLPGRLMSDIFFG